MSVDYYQDEAFLVELETIFNAECLLRNEDETCKKRFAEHLQAINTAIRDHFIGRGHIDEPDLDEAVEQVPGFREGFSELKSILERCGLAGGGWEESSEPGGNGWEIKFFGDEDGFLGFEGKFEVAYVAIDGCLLYEFAENNDEYLFFFDKKTEAHQRLVEFLTPHEVSHYKWTKTC